MIILLNLIWNVIAFIIALGILITVHEFGHFLSARFFSVKVERFSIGFGPILYKWKDSYDTEYVISAIFLGGYVKLLDKPVNQFNNFSKINAFDSQNIWKRGVIIVSGVFFNFLFSVLLYFVIFVVGTPVAKPIIHSIIPGSVFSQYGIPSKVRIESINGVKTDDLESVRFQIFNSIGKNTLTISTVSLENNSIRNTYIVPLFKGWFNQFSTTQDPIIALGILPFKSKLVPIVSAVQFNSAAYHAGLKIGDEILAIDDKLIHNWSTFIKIIQDSPRTAFKISVKRNNEIFYLRFKLNQQYSVNCNKMVETVGLLPKIIFFPLEKQDICRYDILDSLIHACNRTWQLICLTINMLIKLFFSDIKITSLGGPISIAKGAGESAKLGFIYYLTFISIISINLGVINLLPLPTLDGGHLLFLMIEKINRKPIAKKIQNIGYTIGLFVLILFICIVFFNDINRLR